MKKRVRRRHEGLVERQAAFDAMSINDRKGRKRPGSLNRKRTHRSKRSNV